MADAILGVILAGGASARLAPDKALEPLAGKPMIAHVADRLRPQVEALAVAGGASPERFSPLGLDAFADAQSKALGPLAGLAAALDHAAARGFSHVVTAPCDAPFLPRDLVARLKAEGGVAIAAVNGRLEPTFALWPVSAAHEARALLRAGAGPLALARRLNAEAASFGDASAFANINTPADLAAAARLLA